MKKLRILGLGLFFILTVLIVVNQVHAITGDAGGGFGIQIDVHGDDGDDSNNNDNNLPPPSGDDGDEDGDNEEEDEDEDRDDKNELIFLGNEDDDRDESDNKKELVVLGGDDGSNKIVLGDKNKDNNEEIFGVNVFLFLLLNTIFLAIILAFVLVLV